LASYEEKKFIWNGKEQVLKRGQLITGRFALAKETGQSPSSLRNRCQMLAKMGIVDIKSNNKFSLITIVKYSQYQYFGSEKDSKKDNQLTSNGQQTDTYNKVNKDNKVNKNTIAETSSAEWTLEDYKKKLEDSDRREMNIIALYWDYKKPILNSVEQARNEVKRNIRAARDLVPYEDKRLVKTIEYLTKQANFKWTLESVLKYITERDLKNA
jgi:hypothetical protein